MQNLKFKSHSRTDWKKEGWFYPHNQVNTLKQTLQKYTLEFEPREQRVGQLRANESRSVLLAAQLGHMSPGTLRKSVGRWYTLREKPQPQTKPKLRTTRTVFSKTQILPYISSNSLDFDPTHCKGPKSYISAMPADTT